MARLVVERSFSLGKVPPGSSQVDLVFHNTRGKLLGLPKDFAEKRGKRGEGKVSDAVVRLGCSKGEKLPARIPVLTEGEAPELVKTVFRDAEGRRLAEVRPRRGIEIDSDKDALPPEQFMEELENALGPEHDDNEVQRHRKFFADFDRRTHGTLYSVGGCDEEERRYRDEAIRLIKQDLVERVTERARSSGAALQHKVHVDHVPSFLTYLSALQLGVLRAHYPVEGDSEAIDLERFEESFEMFANGELRVRLPSLVVACQPSSGFFFLFGEFALTAAEHGVETAQWTALANVMVRCQRIFARLYAPGARPAAGCRFEDFEAGSYDNRRIFTPSEKARLRDEFRGKSLQELALAATRHAGQHLSGLRASPATS